MTLKLKHCPPPSAPRALPTPSALGKLIVRHAGPLSIELLSRNVPTGGQIDALSDAICNQDDGLSGELALKLALMDPGHPDAASLLRMLGTRTHRVLN